MTHVSESLNSMPEGKVVYLPGEKVVYQEKSDLPEGKVVNQEEASD